MSTQQYQHPGVDALREVPDQELINLLVAHGQPRHSASQIKLSPSLRLSALRFWADVQDAGQGDRQAQQRVDYCREAWQAMRRVELVADNPMRTV